MAINSMATNRGVSKMLRKIIGAAGIAAIALLMFTGSANAEVVFHPKTGIGSVDVSDVNRVLNGGNEERVFTYEVQTTDEITCADPNDPTQETTVLVERGSVVEILSELSRREYMLLGRGEYTTTGVVYVPGDPCPGDETKVVTARAAIAMVDGLYVNGVQLSIDRIS